MKITKTRLKELIKEELVLISERGETKDQADVTALFRRVPDEVLSKIDKPYEILNLFDELFARLGDDGMKRAAPILKPYFRKVLTSLSRWGDEEIETSTPQVNKDIT
jgi:hypothetical protein